MNRPVALRSAGVLGVRFAPRMSLRRAATISARISANPELAKMVKRSKRFDFSHSRLFAGASWTVLNVALVAHAILSEGRGEFVLETIFAGTAAVSTVCQVWWAVRNYFSRRPSVDGEVSSQPSPEEQAYWRQVGARMSYLQAEISKRQKHHRSVRPLLDELRDLRTAVLIGRACDV